MRKRIMPFGGKTTSPRHRRRRSRNRVPTGVALEQKLNPAWLLARKVGIGRATSPSRPNRIAESSASQTECRLTSPVGPGGTMHRCGKIDTWFGRTGIRRLDFFVFSWSPGSARAEDPAETVCQTGHHGPHGRRTKSGYCAQRPEVRRARIRLLVPAEVLGQHNGRICSAGAAEMHGSERNSAWSRSASASEGSGPGGAGQRPRADPSVDVSGSGVQSPGRYDLRTLGISRERAGPGTMRLARWPVGPVVEGQRVLR